MYKINSQKSVSFSHHTTKQLKSGKKNIYNCSKNYEVGTSLMAQWIRIHLQMQGTWVCSLV